MSELRVPLLQAAEAASVAAGPLLALPAAEAPTAILDFETTGLSAASGDRVCEVAVLRVDPGQTRPRRLSALVAPGIPMPPVAYGIHRISDEMLRKAPPFHQVLPQLAEILGGAVVVAHNARFDLGFLRAECHRLGLPVPDHGPVICTLDVSRHIFGLNRCSLAALARRLEIPQDHAHRAMADCRTTLEVYRQLVQAVRPDRSPTVGELLELVRGLRKGGPMRRAIEQQLAEAAAHRRTVVVDYTARSGGGPLVNRRTITVHRVRFPYVEALCHMRGDDRVFHVRRILRVLPAP